LFRNIKKIGFDLPQLTQNKTETRYAQTITCVLAVLVVSGCVSQQSAFDFGGTPAVQPVPTGVTLTGDNSSVASQDNTSLAVAASNIPVKAPRPSLSLAQEPAAVEQAASAQQVAQTVTPVAASVPGTEGTLTPKPESSLAIAAASQQTPTANVISSATTVPITAQTAVQNTAAATTTQTATQNAIANTAIPQPKPVATNQPQQNVEVASLSPAVETATSVQVPEAPAVKKKSFFEKLFAPKEKKPRPSVNVNKPKVQKTTRVSSRIATATSVADRPVRNASKLKTKRTKKIVASVRASRANEGSALPGVKSNSEIFGIKNEDANTSNRSQTTQVAAVGSFGRLSPNGLRIQHSKVQVACLKPGVLRILKVVERHYGKKPIITSGYRSPKRNRRAGGARNSQHIFCKAVDIQVEGVSKWKLAKFLRTVPGRGGVGTYCRTKSVHFDIGSKRDWHHPCRKSSKRKRKKA